MSLKLGQYLKHLGIPKTSGVPKTFGTSKKVGASKKVGECDARGKSILRVTVDLIAVNLDMAAVTGTAVFL